MYAHRYAKITHIHRIPAHVMEKLEQRHRAAIYAMRDLAGFEHLLSARVDPEWESMVRIYKEAGGTAWGVDAEWNKVRENVQEYMKPRAEKLLPQVGSRPALARTLAPTTSPLPTSPLPCVRLPMFTSHHYCLKP